MLYFPTGKYRQKNQDIFSHKKINWLYILFELKPRYLYWKKKNV